MDEDTFWADKYAEEMLKKWPAEKQVIVTGTSISGEPHLGSANDMIRGDAIRKAVEDKGGKAELIWIADDIDPYRSIPAGFPEELRKYLGWPVAFIPDVWGCHKNFANHFEEMLLNHLKEVGVKPTVLLGVEMYRKGMYNEAIKIAMEKRRGIAAILNKYRETPLGDDWWPINIICEKCGKVVTTQIISYDPKTATVDYICSPEETVLHKKSTVTGCGHKSKTSVLNGKSKLTWRVEWACRWWFLKANCEPFGKEHAASGGSWDTGKEIEKEIYGRDPPVPVVYEHFQVEGSKMSKSKGNVITVPIMLEIMRPQELKFWMYFGKIKKAREINFAQMPIQVSEEFDKAERIYFGEKSGNDKDDANYKRAYEMSVIKMPKRAVQAPFTFCADVVQYSRGNEIEALKKTGHIPKDITPEERKQIEMRLENCRNWLKEYAPDQFKLEILKKMPDVIVNPAVGELFDSVASKLDLPGEELQQLIYSKAKEKGIPLQEVFSSAYRLFLGKDTGPRLGPFLASLDKEFAAKRLRMQG